MLNQKKEMLSTNTRIRKLRKTLDLTQQAFADRLGIRQNTVAKYETNRGVPTRAVISLICREFNVNESWLRTGDGEMFQTKPKDEIDELLARHRIPPEFRALAESFLDMKPEEQKVLTDYMQKVAAAIGSGSLYGISLSKLKAESYAAGQAAAQSMDSAADEQDQHAIYEAEARAKAEAYYRELMQEREQTEPPSHLPTISADYSGDLLA